MKPKSLPPHIQDVCDAWHQSDMSEIYKMGTFNEFDPASVIREIESKKNDVSVMRIGEYDRKTFLNELSALKLYVIGLVQSGVE